MHDASAAHCCSKMLSKLKISLSKCVHSWSLEGEQITFSDPVLFSTLIQDVIWFSFIFRTDRNIKMSALILLVTVRLSIKDRTPFKLYFILMKWHARCSICSKITTDKSTYSPLPPRFGLYVTSHFDSY